MLHESAQIRRTKDHIKTHLLKLMAVEGIEKLSVVQLVEVAEINRGTFYHHYQDKYQVLEEIEAEVFAAYFAILAKNIPANLEKITDLQAANELEEFLYGQILTVTDFFYERREVMRLLLGPNGDAAFVKKVKEAYIGFVKRKLALITENLSDSDNYKLLFVSNGIISVIQEWLIKEGLETPEQMARLIAKAFFQTPIELLGLR